MLARETPKRTITLMNLLDSILSSISGQSSGSAASGDATHALSSAIGSLFEQSGGMQGLMEKFQKGGLGEVFSSWVGQGANMGINPEQLQNVLGSEQLQAIASKLGIDPSQASGFIADLLPKAIDKLTPGGELDANSNLSGGLASLLPSLLSGLGGGQDRA